MCARLAPEAIADAPRLETLHGSVGAPCLEQLGEFGRPAEEEGALAKPRFRLPLGVVVAGRALLGELDRAIPNAHDARDPLVLRLLRRFELPDSIAQRAFDEIGDVSRLEIDPVWEVRREARLRDAHHEAVREAADVQAVERAHAVGPLLGERLTVAPDDPEAGAMRVVGADLEAGGEDQAVQRELFARGDHALLRHPLDALSARIDQRHVGAIERLEILVVEARALAELPVPRFQRLGRARIRDDRVHARADLLHLLEVGELERARHGFGREVRFSLASIIVSSCA